MARRKIIVFYAWQSDRPTAINRNFIRNALDKAAAQITGDPSSGVDVLIDADTEGVVGTPPVTETILGKIAAADVFVPDLTFVAETDTGKLTPNPNVMIEYGYALRALTFTAMMPVMNTHFGPPESLPFDMGHVRYPTQYEASPEISDGERRKRRDRLSQTLEAILRLMIQDILSRSRTDAPFTPTQPLRTPAFFFQPRDVLANFGNPGEQEMRFKRDRAIYIRLFPTYADQPRVGLTRAIEVASRLKPPQRVISSLNKQNEWGAINLQPHGDGITSFTQIFESGELWGASEEPFRNDNMIAAIGVEKGYVTALDNYRLVYERDLKLRPPFTIEFGATGLKGQYLLIPSVEVSSGELAGPIRRDSISRQYQLASFDKAEWTAALRGFLIEFYDLSARERDQVLTQQHIEANQLPPL
ncbi:hypothetical protein V5F72_00685 [Xanthobacter flavus]|uniref:hypothetical protein n=1 Tax=Xanthobacter flavus TaxID=281 RepID=UPI00372C3B9D